MHIVYNEFVNTMTQTPTTKQLLPLPKSEDETVSAAQHWDYIYEPEARELLDNLLERYMELQVYQGVVENIACEQAAKMIAMKNATDNAGDLIKEFQLAYNKARQAAITQELAVDWICEIFIFENRIKWRACSDFNFPLTEKHRPKR